MTPARRVFDMVILGAAMIAAPQLPADARTAPLPVAPLHVSQEPLPPPPVRGVTTWTHTALGDVIHTPLVTDDLLVFATTDPRELVALDRQQGTTRWVLPIPTVQSWTGNDERGSTELGSTVATSHILPLILANGSLRTVDLTKGTAGWVFTPTGGVVDLQTTTVGHLIRSGDGSLHVLRHESGRLRWRFRPSPNDGVVTMVTAATPELYLATRNGFVRSLDDATGVQRWQSPLIEDLVATQLHVTERRVIIRQTTGKLVALERRTGEPAWKVPFDGELVGEPLVIGANILLATRSGTLTCLTDGLGDRLWQSHVSSRIDTVTVSDRLIVVTGRDGDQITVLSARRGTILWRHRPGSVSDGRPTIMGALVLVAGPAGLTAHHGRSGRAVWHLPLPGQPTTFGYVIGAGNRRIAIVPHGEGSRSDRSDRSRGGDDRRDGSVRIFGAVRGGIVFAAPLTAPSWSRILTVDW